MFLRIFTLLLIFHACLTVTAQDNSQQQQPDSSLARNITISGFCLCKTTLQDLRNLDSNLKETEVEEMDLPKKCISRDSRYESGKGHYSVKYPGLIFQKDENTDFVSKIRLTKEFNGKLPNGNPVNMKDLLLKDVFGLYPAMKSKWGSRGCSDYWNFSNDTLSFFVKIDKSKIPQFPIDEAYYLDKPIEGIDLMISCYGIFHKTEHVDLFGANEPVYFLDSVRVNAGVLKNYEPKEIAFINVYKGEHALEIAGKEAKNGVIYIMTKEFARDKYFDYFSSKSPEYKKSVPDLKTETEVVYILNNKILHENQESDLVVIDDSSFIELGIINSSRLKKEFHISGKKIGVVIKTALK